MSEITIKVDIKLSEIIVNSDKFNKELDYIIAAGMSIVEDKYVQEAPVNIGNFRQGIQYKKIGNLDYDVISTTTTNKGFNYPLALYTGTRKMRGMPDYGYTTGRVRANDVAYGIGGIRPNKVANRATKKSDKPLSNFLIDKLNKLMQKTITK